MKYCVYCGNGIPDEGVFCGSCGKKQESVKIDVENESYQKNDNDVRKMTMKQKFLNKFDVAYLIVIVGIIFVAVTVMYMGATFMLGDAFARNNTNDIRGYSKLFDESRNWLRIQLVFSLLFIYWVYKSYKKLPSITGEKTRWSAGWAVGAWLIPILNLFRPYQVMRELWNKSNPEKSRVKKSFFSVSNQVGTWWFTTLVGSFYGRFTTNRLFDVISTKSSKVALQEAFSSDLWSTMFLVASVVWSIYLVIKISKWQKDSTEFLNCDNMNGKI